MPDLYTAPAVKGRAVTKSDSTIINARTLWVGGTGHVTVTMLEDSDPVTFSNVPAGTLLPISVAKVMDATTATNIVALY